MGFEIKKRDGVFWVIVTWPDGETCDYGVFPNKDFAEGFVQGFGMGIHCHT